MNVRARLTLWTVGIVMTVVVAFAVGIFLFAKARLDAQHADQLERAFVAVRETCEHHVEEAYELEKQGIVYFEITEGGTVLHRTEGFTRANLADGRFSLKRGTVTEAGRTFQIAVAVDGQPFHDAWRTLGLILLLGVPATAGLALLGGYVLAGRLLAPVGAMADKGRCITADRLSERLPVDNPRDEFGQLATVVNETLARLQQSFEQLRRFTADASHELRTPLTAMRAVGEVAMQKSNDAAAYRDVIGSMLEETDRLSRLVENLLTLTRADGGSVKPAPERVDLKILASASTDLLRVLAEEKEQTLSVEGDDGIVANADPGILRLAVVNLVDNAIKYTPAQGTISIRVHSVDGEARIEVKDSGPGIAPEHRERIFDRFYRVDRSRSRDEGGVGLGLSIAKWAAEVNGGSIRLVSEENRGSTFTIALRKAE